MASFKPTAGQFQPDDPISRGLAQAFLLNERGFATPSVRNLAPGGVGGAVLAGTPTWALGPYGPCVDFPNTAGSTSTNLVRLGAFGALTEGTIYIQVSFDTLATQTLAGCIFNATGRVYMGVNLLSQALFRLGGVALQTATAATITVGKPVVMALAFSTVGGQTFDGYTDGQKVVGAVAWTGTAGVAATAWDIGGVSTQAAALDGQVHAFLLYSQRHTDGQVQRVSSDLQAGEYSWSRPPWPDLSMIPIAAGGPPATPYYLIDVEG